MQRLAESKGGKCLSSKYIHSQKKLTWECAIGHRWEAMPHSIRQGTWCPTCFIGSRKNTFQEVLDLAQAKGGRCLSTRYTNNKAPLLFECSKRHRWWAKPNTIQQGHWCAECAGVKRKTIKEMHQLAAKRGGECLSDIYINMNFPLEWECEQGHRWFAKPNSIQQGKWCLECSGKSRKTIEDMQALAAEREGVCLSTEYNNVSTPLIWQCKRGHQWSARPMGIIRRQWCPYCAGKVVSLADMKEYAAVKGGRCLSTSYRGNARKHEWECAEGHRWLATPNAIQRGQWCPDCSKGVSERIVRVHFEQLFGQKFPTRKPRWLVNNRGSRMELDGYCKSLKSSI